MYQLLQDLLPYLVGFYILDAVVWARAGQVLLAAPLGGSFRLKDAGLHLVGLWPLAEYVIAWDPPIVYGPSAFYVTPADGAVPAPAPEATGRAYGSLRKPTVTGRSVEDEGRLLIEAPSPAAAAGVARSLEALAAASETERPGTLRRILLERMDTDAVREVRRDHLRFSRPMKALAAALFAGVFVLLPLAVFLESPRLPGAGTVLLLLAPVHAALLVLAHRTLKACGVRSTAAVLVPMVFFPPAAIHALSTIARDLYVRFDPLAVAAVVLDARALETVARRERSRLDVARERAPADLAEYWGLRLSLLTELVSRLGGDPEAMLRPPGRTDDGAAAYCPLCFSEYRAGFGRCVDCEVDLKAYPAG